MTAPAETPVWAAFDFDGTLTRQDSLLPFLRGILGTPRLTAILAAQSPWLIAYLAGWLPNDQVKERLLRRTVRGMHRDVLQTRGEIFAARHIPHLLRPTMLQRVRQHQALGHVCVLVTASLTLYTRPWALAAGFDHVIGSEMGYDDNGLATGLLQGGNCYGAEKAKRLRAILPDQARLYAYGDSRGDREMLSMADIPWLINAKNAYGGSIPSLQKEESHFFPPLQTGG